MTRRGFLTTIAGVAACGGGVVCGVRGPERVVPLKDCPAAAGFEVNEIVLEVNGRELARHV